MIDLHMHTTASDGLCPPADVVRRCRDAGLRILSVTDHDTVAAVGEVAAAAEAEGLTAIPGIEVTSVWNGRDVHILGYFIETDSPRLRTFLEGQRQQRLERAHAIADRLTALEMPIDIETVLAPARDQPGRAVGRPWIARAMMGAGYVASVQEAFDRWLGRGRPAFVPRRGASPAEAIRAIGDAGGIASLAHPGLLKHDELVPGMVDAGLAALEAYHSEHDEATIAHYLAMADSLGLVVSGGSDFHGGGAHGVAAPGAVRLPADRFERFRARARNAHTRS
jgi:predicted metal-dependent phosphoesterase TrpH